MSIQSARKSAELLVANLGITRPPVNVASVAEHLGISVVTMRLDDGVSGLLISKPGMTCIATQETESPQRQRFSIAHELGHYCLGHQFEPGEHVHVDRGHLISHRNQQSSMGTNLKEIEANQFAASLLMPAVLVRQCIDELGTDYIYDGHITELADKFKVSEQAMTIRLSALGIV